MPKTSNTRRERAQELLKRIERGPAFLNEIPYSFPKRDLMTSTEAQRSYDLWARSWIIGELIDLVPELRKLRDEAKKASDETHV